MTVESVGDYPRPPRADRLVRTAAAAAGGARPRTAETSTGIDLICD
jgi:hypothetical protein